MQQKKEDAPIKRMAELLRRGETLTDLSCPVCFSPLFRLHDGTLWCAKDEKKVVIVKEGQEPPKPAQATATNSTYEKVEATLLAKILDIQAKIEKTEDIDELQKLTVALSELLNSLEKIKKIKGWTPNLTLGHHENFPLQVHRVEGYNSSLSAKQLQEKILHILQVVNGKEFCFEEVAIPTVPGGRVIFEFGLADGQSFSYLDETTLETALGALSKETQVLDFFCVIRYYKGVGDKKTPLKFDYYMIRTLYDKGVLEVQIYHERGPRYVTPQDLSEFIVGKVNGGQTRKILKPLPSIE